MGKYRFGMIKAAAAALSFTFISGCQLLAFSPEAAVSVPPSRLFPSQWMTAGLGDAHVTISRELDFYRREQCSEIISVDGVKQARIQPGERLDLYLTAGSHVIRAKPDGGCQGMAAEFEQNVGAGQWLWYRLDVDGQQRSLYFKSYAGKKATRAVAANTAAVPPPTWSRGGSGSGNGFGRR